MTPIERAEKIVGMMMSNPQAQGYDGLRAEIAAQIEEACKEHHLEMVSAALSNGTLWAQEAVRKALEEAEREAYEKFRKDFRWACQCENVDCALEREIISRGATKLEQKGYAEGFRAAREKAKGMVHSGALADLIKRIGEMEP